MRLIRGVWILYYMNILIHIYIIRPCIRGGARANQESHTERLQNRACQSTSCGDTYGQEEASAEPPTWPEEVVEEKVSDADDVPPRSPDKGIEEVEEPETGERQQATRGGGWPGPEQVYTSSLGSWRSYTLSCNCPLQ